ncbi:hypothetical protein ALC56_09913 [Trachymyrmex septentrionalis]|uniref:Uncharacterized protein n=1 Tax=Trachymyrmex septentrionalis TaxID=34720 RepID=A0A195F5H4_9HYME|nr:hypothetical protein ALC56_09913 [Trachymyrmex septentrionalis]
MRSIADANDVNNSKFRVKLPVIKLPTFDGRTEEWKRFSKTFLSMIYINEGIPSIQKFMPKVDKKAANAIKSLVDYLLRHLRVLKSTNLSTDSWDELITHMIKAKFNKTTLRA